MREIKNAVIKDARITKADGYLGVWLELDYGGVCQGFGGYALYLPKSCKNHDLKSIAGHFLYRILEIADIDSWSSLKGKTIRVDSENIKIHGIGHIVKDDWFYPGKDFSND